MSTLKVFLIWLSTSFGGAVPTAADVDTGSAFDLVEASAEEERSAPPPASNAREKDDGGIYNGF